MLSVFTYNGFSLIANAWCLYTEPIQHPNSASAMHCQPGLLQRSRCQNHRDATNRCPPCGEQPGADIKILWPHILWKYATLSLSRLSCGGSLFFSVFRSCDVLLKSDSMFCFLIQLKFKILELVTSASVELPSSSPMFLHEERPVRHVSQQQPTLHIAPVFHTESTRSY